jgi:hypothetical protein
MSSTGANTFGPSDQLARNLAFLDGDDSEASEMSWGSGLVPKGLQHAPPSDGGMYSGRTPPCDPQVGVSRR